MKTLHELIVLMNDQTAIKLWKSAVQILEPDEDGSVVVYALKHPHSRVCPTYEQVFQFQV